MCVCPCAPESVCVDRKGARQTSSLKRPEIKFIHSGPAARNRSGGGPSAPERSGCSSLCRAVTAHAPRSRACPPARPPRNPGRAAAPPSLHRGGEGGAFCRRPGPQGWGWGLGASQRGCRRRRAEGPREEEEGAGGGGDGRSARSCHSEQGHVHGAPPGRAANRGEALHAASAELPRSAGSADPAPHTRPRAPTT